MCRPSRIQYFTGAPLSGYNRTIWYWQVLHYDSDLAVIQIYLLEGKSFWTIYAICRRLAEGKPVMWYRANGLYLFVREGVFMSPDKYPPTDFETPIWTLVDADGNPGGVPPFLAEHGTKHLIIFTSSPQSARWKALEKTTTCKVDLQSRYHEPLDKGRDITSVSTSASVLYVRADHFT